jgi:hypothetical protein
LRPLATIHATIMLKRAAANGAASDSIFCRPYEVTPRSAFVLWRNGTNGTFRSIQDFAGRNRTGGQAIVAPRIAGENSIAANLPPHSDGKASAA